MKIQVLIERFLIAFLFIFCFFSQGYSQESLIVYSKPIRLEKINGQFITDAIIVYRGKKIDLSIELNGAELNYKIEGDSLKVKLPLIGNEGHLVFKNKSIEIKAQMFHPFIPSDWGYFKGGTIHIVNTSHQDIAWVNTPDTCRDNRIHKLIIPALRMGREHPDFAFGMEQTLNLREILDIYPQYKTSILQAYQKGSFSWGATFNQPYEGLLSGEQLVRQLYLGRKWVHDKFDNKMDTKTAFNLDVPGRSTQFPQILAKSGVKYLVISRMKEGFYNWFSPDGSKVLTYSPGNYSTASLVYKYFNEDAATAMQKINKELKNWDTYYSSRNLAPHFAVMIARDASGPVYYNDVIQEWNKIVEQSGLGLPILKYSTGEEFLKSIDKPGANFDHIEGDRPNLWLYIHGPAHYEAIKAKKEAGIQLPAAEMFNTINSLLKNDFEAYAGKSIDSAWYKSIYDDHGWGGYHGEITDSIFSAYLHQSNQTANQIVNKSLVSISSLINTNQINAMVVFNNLSWKRAGLGELMLPSKGHQVYITDKSGQPVISQSVIQGDSTLIHFMVDSVPSIGYTTFYFSKKKKEIPSNHRVLSNWCENSYYKIEFGNGGIVDLFDKQVGKHILNTADYAGGDVMDLGYDGNDAGEFTEITKTNMTNYDKLSYHRAIWKIIEDGDLFTTFQSGYLINEVEIIQRIKVYHSMKQITFEYEIPNWKGVANRQLRFALPIGSESASISYDVPMAVNTVGQSELKIKPGGWSKEGTYNNSPIETHPREVQNFVSANAADFGLTMSSGISVFDWLDPKSDAATYPVIQAIMLSSHKSCNARGNWYLQKGAHKFTFSITTHKPGWKNGYEFGIGNNHAFYTIMQKGKNSFGELPATLSFIKSSSPFVLVTAFKKSENDDKAIIRIVEMSGKEEKASLEFYKKFKTAVSVNLIEEEPGTNTSENSNLLNMILHQNSIESYKIKF